MFYQVTDPPATANHVFRWRVVGDTTYTTISPNPTPILVSAPNNYKVQLPNIPVCQDVEVSIQRQCANNQNSIVQTSVAQKGLSYGCTESVSGTRTGSGSYIYPVVLLDLSNAPETVTFNYFTVDKNNPSSPNPPNRFLFKNAEDVTVFSSDWKGQANYIGPWQGGVSLNTPTSGSFTFNRGVGCFYTVLVDTFPNGTQTDVWSLAINCTTVGDPPTDPTIDFVSCSDGFGRYTITGTSGTILKVGISASGQLVNNNTPNNCARIDVGMTSSLGTDSTITDVSPLVTGTGTTSVGTTNTVFLDLVIPATGYIVIDTSVIFKNSPVSDEASATLTIFQVNGVAKSITRSLCIGSATASIPCVTDPPSCTCPSGFTATPDGSLCVKEETTAATAPTETTANRTLVARSLTNYSGMGSAIYTGGYNATTGAATGPVQMLMTSFWRNSDWVNNQGPLNRTAVWTSVDNIGGQRVSFSTCINITQTKTYLVGVGCDNFADIKLNGVNIVTQSPSAVGAYFRTQGATIEAITATFLYWHIYPVTINAGNNILEIAGNNIDGPAAIGVEVYDATPAELAAVTSYTNLGPKLLFSTKDLRGTVVTGGNNGLGYSCPTGYVLKACGLTTPICYKVSETNCVSGLVTLKLESLSCLNGYGSYKITAAANTTMKVSLSVAGNLTNTSTDGYCAKINAIISAVPGLSANGLSNSIINNGTATVGANNALFVSVTVPSNGIVIINTQATAINSTAAMVNGALRIFEINGVAQASSVDKTLSVCIGEATGVAICT